MTATRGAMRFLIDRDINHAVQDALDQNSTFDACKWPTGARVDAATERHVLTGILTIGTMNVSSWLSADRHMKSQVRQTVPLSTRGSSNGKTHLSGSWPIIQSRDPIVVRRLPYWDSSRADIS